ncbi:MAG TPA: ATP-binding cassette domain-containing protein [Gemmata sp.]|nr:ATP-binding cassette domain-containing protein [Gemmata sp.]
MIGIEGLTIRQGGFELTGVTFSVSTGGYAVLMGRTGVGKTTVLECIAGLRRPAAGRILLAGLDVSALSPAARNVGYVPQDSVMFNTMTVRENIGFALEIRRTPREETERRVQELAASLGIAAILDRPAHSLSGGEAQRVALGRALAFRPRILLLDEPLNAVDEATRERLVQLLRDIRAEGKLTVLHVTHNRTEAEMLADRILRFEDGRVIPDEKS